MKGYFRKRGNLWSFTVDIGRDTKNGKRIQKTRSGFKTKKEAQIACAELITQLENNTYIEPKKILLRDFLDSWLEDHCRYHNSPSTYDQLKSKCNSRIIPYFGAIKLKDLQPMHVSKFHADLFEQGLSSIYIATLHSILNRALNYAIKMDLIAQNPASKVGKPKATTKTPQVWTFKECRNFLDNIRKHEIYYQLFHTAIKTGMRRSELLALTWDDIDFINKKIHVNKALYYKSKTDYEINPPKSKASNRQISVDDFLLEDLSRYKDKWSKKGSQLVFSDLDGKPLSPTAIGDYFRRTMKKLDLPKIRFHDIRHTHATLLLKTETNPKIVQERLGHEKIQITLDTYSHVLPDMQKECANVFSKALDNLK